MWTRNVLIVAALGALSATPLLAQQKTVAAPRTVATAVRDTVQSRHVRHAATKARSVKAPATKADTTKALTTASRATASTSKAHAKHTAKHTAKRSTKHGMKRDSASVLTPSPAKP